MSKRIATIVGLLLTAGLQMSALAVPVDLKETKRPPTSPVASIRPSSTVPTDTLSRSSLLADGYTIKEHSEAEERLHESKLAEALKLERINNPAIEIYGEDSWSDNVNPFVGGSRPEIPAKYDIDCTGFVMPLEGEVRVNSRYGYRRRYHRHHKGIDLALKTGDNVRAAFDGKVRVSGFERRGFGHYIIIRHPNGLETIYGHLSRRIAKEGDIVHAGDVIGKGGSTGRSTGPHLHFETRFLGQDINPERIINFAIGAPENDYYTFIGPSTGKVYSHDDNEKPTGDKYTELKSKSSRSLAKAPRIYRVKKGDTLAAIAKRTGSSVQQLCKKNNISQRARLRIGQTLKY